MLRSCQEVHESADEITRRPPHKLWYLQYSGSYACRAHPASTMCGLVIPDTQLLQRMHVPMAQSRNGFSETWSSCRVCNKTQLASKCLQSNPFPLLCVPPTPPPRPQPPGPPPIPPPRSPPSDPPLRSPPPIPPSDPPLRSPPPPPPPPPRC